eukprot:1351797-Rhodomonas_salina.1
MLRARADEPACRLPRAQTTLDSLLTVGESVTVSSPAIPHRPFLFVIVVFVLCFFLLLFSGCCFVLRRVLFSRVVFLSRGFVPRMMLTYGMAVR